jgi:hypothetical protein
MRPKYTIIIDTNHLAGVDQTKRERLEKYLRTAGRRVSPNIRTVDCKTPTAVLRAVSKLTDRGLPQGSFLVRGGAA